MAEIKLRQIKHHMMAASDSQGHSIVIGRSPDEDQKWVGLKPSELLLIAAASCSTYDVVEIMEKQRETYSDLVVTCSGEQRTDPPYNFTRIHLHYSLKGQVEIDKLMKAIQLSVEKYCSVISTFRPETSVTYDCEVINE